ncbi:MAG: hypothetical protein ABIP90_07150 [Vicinamibacterales bacterium]
MANAVRRSPLSGAQLAAALVAILFATAGLPPAAAWTLNKTRITQTQDRARAATERLRVTGEWSTAFASNSGIVCGPGRLPDREPPSGDARAAVSLAAHGAWLRGARVTPDLFGPGMPTDAWGRCFLLNVDSWMSGRPVWLLSAGPNGLIDTPPDATELGGDDIGGRLQ